MGLRGGRQQRGGDDKESECARAIDHDDVPTERA